MSRITSPTRPTTPAYWTQCIADLGHTAIKQNRSYQDQYLEAVGAPASLMEVMAITQVFEKRVIGQYHRRTCRVPGTHPEVRQTIERIMRDERWHVKYVREALAAMAGRYGAELIEETLARYTAADEEVYAKTLAEYGERVDVLGRDRGPAIRMRVTVLGVWTDQPDPVGSLTAPECAQLSVLAGSERRRQWLTSRHALRVLLGLLGYAPGRRHLQLPSSAAVIDARRRGRDRRGIGRGAARRPRRRPGTRPPG